MARCASSISSAGAAVAEGTLLPGIGRGGAAWPVSLARRPLPRDPRRTQWVEMPERGTSAMVAFGIATALRIGRPLARLGLYIVAAYFFAFAPSVRRASRDYLRRVLGRAPTAADRFRQIYAFSITLLDRLYLLKERFDLFQVSSEGEELMLETLARGNGAFLLGSHLGSFALVSSVGRQPPGPQSGDGHVRPAGGPAGRLLQRQLVRPTPRKSLPSGTWRPCCASATASMRASSWACSPIAPSVRARGRS